MYTYMYNLLSVLLSHISVVAHKVQIVAELHAIMEREHELLCPGTSLHLHQPEQRRGVDAGSIAQVGQKIDVRSVQSAGVR